MAKKKASKQPRKPSQAPVAPGTAHGFITLNLSTELLATFGQSASQQEQEKRKDQNAEAAKKIFVPVVSVENHSITRAGGRTHVAPNTANQPPTGASDMQTRGAWEVNRSNPKRQKTAATDIKSEPDHDALPLNRPATPGKRATPNRKRKQADREPSTTVPDVFIPQAVKKRRIAPRRAKSVSFDPEADVVIIHSATDLVSSTSSPESRNNCDKENQEENDMERPKLNLKFSFNKSNNDGFAKPAPPSTAGSPTAQTPKIKLNFGNKGQDSSGKKRKRADTQQEVPIQTPTSGVPKIKLKTAVTKVSGPSPVTPGAAGLKLQTKGRIPKRHPGVGYDSELSDTERDPVILEGFILRMQPGPDCDYIRDHINRGTMGVSKLQGGADIGISVADTSGRRCSLRVRQNKYAATLVDLPTIIEGMKSWDKMRFIKSVDVCQMMIVLGPIKNDEEAKTYPLPPGVDPKTYQYAHGLTAPMQWVRKRRFERTKRTRVEDIENVDRRVGQLLASDAAALSVVAEQLDYDPRVDEDQYSGTEDEDEDEDDDADGEADDYFAEHNEHVDDEIGEAEVDEFTQMFEDADEDIPSAEAAPATNGAIDSSGFVTSAADSPDVTGSQAPTTAPTPAGEVSTPAAPTPGTDGDNESDDDEDQEDREAQNEEDEQKSQMQERIKDLEGKIVQQMEMLKTQTNLIIKRRLAQKIKELQQDVDMLKRELGQGGDEGDED